MSKVLVPLAEGCEELEAITIIDILRRANIEVVTASLGDQTVCCAHQTRLVADYSLDDVMNDDFDLIVLPGGLPGADNLNADKRIQALLTQFSKANKKIAAICAAPKVLVNHGIATGKHITAYPNSLNQLDTSCINLTNDRVEVDGNIITARGPGTALLFALQLIEVLKGKTARQTVEAQLVA